MHIGGNGDYMDDMTEEVVTKAIRQLLLEPGISEELTKGYDPKSFIIISGENIINCSERLNYEQDFYDYVLKHPISVIQELEGLAFESAKRPIVVRFSNLLDADTVRLKEIGPGHLGKLIQFEGSVTRVTEPMSKLIEAHFMCARCGFDNIIPQDGTLMREPYECEGCKKGINQTDFQELHDFGIYIASEVIEVQGNTEDMLGAMIPARIEVRIYGELTGICPPGTRVTIVGIPMRDQKRKGTAMLLNQRYVIDAVNIIPHDNPYEDIDITTSDIATIRKLAKDPEIHARLRKSILQSVYGYDIVKDSIILLLFGGVAVTKADKSYIRGDIHILMIGDPGTAKSQILLIIHGFSRRSILASGQSASKAGLGAAAVKDDLGGGRWTLAAGVLPLADGGIALIDELAQMKKDERGIFLQAMESQKISINKAGINAEMLTRCSILAAANPRDNSFNREETFMSQIELEGTIVDRFDLIWPFVDFNESLKKKEELLDFILDEKGDDEDDIISLDLIQKWISYARSNVFPKRTPEMIDVIKKFVMKLYAHSRPGIIPHTPRKTRSIIRLAEANARLRLSETVDVQDAERAVKIYGHSIGKMGFDADDGEIHLERIIGGGRRSTLNRMRSLLNIILLGKNEISQYEVITEFGKKDINKIDTIDFLKKMKDSGEIYEPKLGLWRKI